MSVFGQRKSTLDPRICLSLEASPGGFVQYRRAFLSISQNDMEAVGERYWAEGGQKYKDRLVWHGAKREPRIGGALSSCHSDANPIGP